VIDHTLPEAEQRATRDGNADRLLSLGEAAQRLGMSASALRKEVERGGIRCFQIRAHGRLKFREQWLEEFIADHTLNAKPSRLTPLRRKRKADKSQAEPESRGWWELLGR
jgi:hypothetical protein